MSRLKGAIILFFMCLPAAAQVNEADYPILRVPRSASSSALLDHKLTDKERLLFKSIDSETVKLPPNSAFSAYHAVAIAVGKRHGLTERQSIAFFTRTTFSEFEP